MQVENKQLVEVEQLLRSLGIDYAAEVLNDVLAAQVANGHSSLWVIQQLCQVQLQRSETRRVANALRLSMLDPQLSFDSFVADRWAGSGSVLAYLRDGNWIDAGQDVVLVGPSGCGKTHLANALGHVALKMRKGVYYSTWYKMIDAFNRADSAAKARVVINRYVRPKVLVLDEFTVVPTEAHTLDYLFQVISQRRQDRRPVVLTTNLVVDKWEQVLGSGTYAQAIVDRLVDGRNILEVIEQAVSYRTGAQMKLAK